jgi:hypothetical protein
MRKPLQFAALLLLIGATTTRAQVTNPDKLIAPPPRNPAHHAIKPEDNLQWLWPFTKPAPLGEAANLRIDARFQAFLQDSFKQPQSMWGPPNTHEPLATIIPLFLTQYGAVTRPPPPPHRLRRRQLGPERPHPRPARSRLQPLAL